MNRPHQLAFDEIFLSVLHGEIIEDYPTDKPYPSCLIYGQTFSGRVSSRRGSSV